MIFEWKEEYSVDNICVDSEHRHLFELANSIIGSSTHDEMIRNVMRLYKHAREHFDHEERLMKDCKYPDYQQHVDDHNKLLAALTSKSDVLKEGDWKQTQVIDFMSTWVFHITSKDKQFKDYYLTSQG